MPDAIASVLPMLLCFACGTAFRMGGVFTQKDASVLLRVVFFVGIPAIVLRSIPAIPLTPELALLPVLGALTHVVTGSVFWMVSGFTNAPFKSRITGVVGVMMMNLGFVFPFLEAGLGEAGIQAALLFDLGNAVFVFSAVYAIATRGGKPESTEPLWKRMAASPPLLALSLALFLNLSGIRLEGALFATVEFVGRAAFPMILIALGIHFRLRPIRLLSAMAVFFRMAGGFATAYLLATLFGIDPVLRSIVALCGAAPVGFNTLTFSVLCDLDTETATEMVSTGVGIGLVVTPVLLYLLP